MYVLKLTKKSFLKNSAVTFKFLSSCDFTIFFVPMHFPSEIQERHTDLKEKKIDKIGQSTMQSK